MARRRLFVVLVERGSVGWLADRDDVRRALLEAGITDDDLLSVQVFGTPGRQLVPPTPGFDEVLGNLPVVGPDPGAPGSAEVARVAADLRTAAAYLTADGIDLAVVLLPVDGAALGDLVARLAVPVVEVLAVRGRAAVVPAPAVPAPGRPASAPRGASSPGVLLPGPRRTGLDARTRITAPVRAVAAAVAVGTAAGIATGVLLVVPGLRVRDLLGRSSGLSDGDYATYVVFMTAAAAVVVVIGGAVRADRDRPHPIRAWVTAFALTVGIGLLLGYAPAVHGRDWDAASGATILTPVLVIVAVACWRTFAGIADDRAAGDEATAVGMLLLLGLPLLTVLIIGSVLDLICIVRVVLRTG